HLGDFGDFGKCDAARPRLRSRTRTRIHPTMTPQQAQHVRPDVATSSNELPGPTCAVMDRKKSPPFGVMLFT
ncbi:hypothetical protein, partial [Xanthomonas fragariae]|uniref:hypothetical protein n=1 Tax=Xanthomonas fragariae TaxID=48664 RepID=UPI001F3D30FB